ncbi:MAG TPA: CopG family transcriptional regulator [Gammaproteobacteria bacterium]|nr:CopG family transcriptional regulator [Gammaproteobacteria bacterium]
MSQVTIYLEEKIEQKMQLAAQAANLSKSKWIAKLIQEKVANEWPQSVVDLAGAWEDFPSIDNLRANNGTDVERESI